MVEEGKSGNGQSFGLLQLVVFLTAVLIVIIFLGGVIASFSFALYGGRAYPIYLISSSIIGILIICSMLATNRWHSPIVTPVYLTGMILLAAYLYAFAASLFFSVVLLIGIVLGSPDPFMAFSRIAFPLVVFLPIAYGLVEARFLRTRRIELRTGKVIGRDLTIVYFSDVHLGILVGVRRLRRIVRIAKEARPDLIIIGGDLYDTEPRYVKWSEPVLRSLPEIAQTFMVTGNHEFFHGVGSCVSTLSDLGIRTLRGEASLVPGVPIMISGLDDPSDMQIERSVPPPIPAPDPRPSIYDIFAYHRPQRFAEAARMGYDLELCGHTHWGQLVPFNVATYLAWGKYYKGLHKRGSSSIYVSSGAGTWGPPVRVMSPPEVVIITVRSG